MDEKMEECREGEEGRMVYTSGGVVINPLLTLRGISPSSPSFAFFINSFTPGSERQNLGRTVVANDSNS